MRRVLRRTALGVGWQPVAVSGDQVVHQRPDLVEIKLSGSVGVAHRGVVDMLALAGKVRSHGKVSTRRLCSTTARLVLPIHTGRRLVGRNPRAAGKPGLMECLGFLAPAAALVAQQARQRVGADGKAHRAQEVQQGRLSDVAGVVTERRDASLERGTEGTVKAGWQRGQDRLVGGGDDLFLTHAADDLDRDDQVLHDGVARAVEARIGRQARRVDYAAFLARDSEGKDGYLAEHVQREEQAINDEFLHNELWWYHNTAIVCRHVKERFTEQ